MTLEVLTVSTLDERQPAPKIEHPLWEKPGRIGSDLHLAGL